MALDAQSPFAYWALAFANLWMRRYDDAIRAAETQIALNPNYAEGYNALGIFLHYVGRSEEALRCFERAMALNPFARGCGCTSRGRRTFNCGATKRPSQF